MKGIIRKIDKLCDYICYDVEKRINFIYVFLKKCKIIIKKSGVKRFFITKDYTIVFDLNVGNIVDFIDITNVDYSSINRGKNVLEKYFVDGYINGVDNYVERLCAYYISFLYLCFSFENIYNTIRDLPELLKFLSNLSEEYRKYLDLCGGFEKVVGYLEKDKYVKKFLIRGLKYDIF
ncbi:MAG: hypothetical protein NC926_07985 [Candidatus Omnitrophica bacterium]|nr:hypothetical protein [Candidatus Omnitrophota bacterium]